MVTLLTERLRLREFMMDDLDEVHKYASDPEVSHYMDWGPNTLNETAVFVKGAVDSQRENPRIKFELAVEHPLHGLIGGCGIYINNVNNKIAEIGYCLNRSSWGKGYGTEVAASLIEFGFKDLKMHRIAATCDPKNIGSWKIMEKNGMTREGILRENKIIRGNWHDSYIYSILEHEWQLE